MLSSSNRGLDTTDCSLRHWEGEVVADIHYSSSILLLLAHFSLAGVCFSLSAAGLFPLRSRVAAHIGISGKDPGLQQRKAAGFVVDATVGQVGLN